MFYIILDTNICSYLFKRDTRAALYQPFLEGSSPTITFQTLAELHQWAGLANWGARRRRELEIWLEQFPLLAADDEVARQWAAIRVARQRLGLPISPQDAWVAACAMRHGLPLVTHNPKDFAEIEGLTLLTAR